MKQSTILTSLVFGILICGSVQAEIVVICNPGYAGDTLSTEQIREIYQGKSTKFPNGDPVKPIDQRGGSDERSRFLGQVMDKTESEMNRYWSRLIFSGKKRPPEVLESSDAVKLWVANNPDGIGYIDGVYMDESVKVLLRFD